MIPIRPCAPALLLCAIVAAQSFEVATIKLNTSGPAGPNGFTTTPGRFRVLNSPLNK